MQAFLFLLISYVLIIFNLHQFRYSSFYIRFERLFLLKRVLAVKKIGSKTFFQVIVFDHLLTNAWMILVLLRTDFMLMAIFFIAMYHSTIIFRKIIPYYTLAWWLDKIIVTSGIIICVTDYYNFTYFRNLNWNYIFLFSISFFLITFTTYIFKQLYIYGTKYWQRIQSIRKGSRS